MTKKLDCVVEGCTATIEADTEAEVMSQAEAHAAEAHPDMELDDEAVESIRSRIEDV
jgi:predicted small metal-binding protein